MKKLIVAVMALTLVFGMSSFAMAGGPVTADAGELEIGIDIGEYFEAGIVTDLFVGGSEGSNPLMGLFNQLDAISGPGLYVSDGGATEGRVQDLFPTNETAQNPINMDGVEMVVVAANTDVNLSMMWADGSYGFQYLDEDGNAIHTIPTIFRFSSNDDILDSVGTLPVLPAGDSLFDEFGVGTYNTDMSVHPGFNNNLISRGSVTWNTILNLGDASGLSGYSWGDHQGFLANFETEEGYSAEDSILIPFRQCTPSLVHINGAFLLEKATAVPAGEYFTTIDLVVDAQI